MKLPKETKRYCPTCKKQTKQKISVAKQKSRSSIHQLSRGGKSRLKSRGLTSGPGNKGKYSMPPPKNRKRKTKSTKRMTLLYTCIECKKTKMGKDSMRTSRLEIGEKVAK